MESQKDLPEGIQLIIVLSNDKVFEIYHFVSIFLPGLPKIKQESVQPFEIQSFSVDPDSY